jgi:hypothetical protein
VHRATKKYLSKPAKSRWYNQSYQGSFCCVLNETNRNKMSHLYEKDYANWAEIMANLLAEKQFDELDIDNLVEEIKDLSKRERDKLISSIRLIIHHLLKWKYQPQKRAMRWALFTHSDARYCLQLGLSSRYRSILLRSLSMVICQLLERFCGSYFHLRR